MEIDTHAIRRLRDYLLSHPEPLQPGPDDPPDDVSPWIGSAIARRVEPFAETMFLVMMADGDPDAAERRALLGALNVLTDGQVSTALLAAMLDRFAAKVAGEDQQVVFAAVEMRDVDVVPVRMEIPDHADAEGR